MKYYYANNGVTAYLMRDIRNKNADFSCTIRWCVTFKRKRVYYSTGISMDAVQWERFEKADEADLRIERGI